MTLSLRRAGLRAATALLTAALPALAVAALFTATAEAQDYTTGAVSGSVSDDSGVVIANAGVTLTSLDQGHSRVVTAGSTGRVSRLTMVWSATTMRAARTMGSFVVWG